MEKDYKRSVGAIWNKIAKNEKKTQYKSISLDLKELREQDVDLSQDKINLVIFRNYQKSKDNQPDYRVVVPDTFNRQTESKKDIGESKADEELLEESESTDEIPF